MTAIIKKIEVSNFKSFNHITLDLNSLNIIIGINASGKSNLITIFRFLRDIVNTGLTNAISLQAGSEYLLNAKIGIKNNLVVYVEISTNDSINIPLAIYKKMVSDFGLNLDLKNIEKKVLRISMESIQYNFEIQFLDSQKFIIKDDLLKVKGNVFIEEYNEKPHQSKLIPGSQNQSLGEVEISSTFKESKMNIDVKGDCGNNYCKFLKEAFSPQHAPVMRTIPKNALQLEIPTYYPWEQTVESIFKQLKIFDIDTKKAKDSGPISGNFELDEDGNNLALIIRNIIQDEQKKKQFLTLVSNFLPFVDDFEVDSYAGKKLYFKTKEIYYDDYWPAIFLSDGTVNLISLIIATNFENRKFTIFEEPEKNIHPMLISKLLSSFKEASEDNQIIITTHNPEFVRHANINDIQFIERDNQGYSKIIKPNEIEKVKIFLKENLGLDELFIRNLISE